ncbi:unnamed protein product, partial [Cyprideis torosa]
MAMQRVEPVWHTLGFSVTTPLNLESCVTQVASCILNPLSDSSLRPVREGQRAARQPAAAAELSSSSIVQFARNRSRNLLADRANQVSTARIKAADRAESGLETCHLCPVPSPGTHLDTCQNKTGPLHGMAGSVILLVTRDAEAGVPSRRDARGSKNNRVGEFPYEHSGLNRSPQPLHLDSIAKYDRTVSCLPKPLNGSKDQGRSLATHLFTGIAQNATEFEFLRCPTQDPIRGGWVSFTSPKKRSFVAMFVILRSLRERGETAPVEKIMAEGALSIDPANRKATLADSGDKKTALGGFIRDVTRSRSHIEAVEVLLSAFLNHPCSPHCPQEVEYGGFALTQENGEVELTLEFLETDPGTRGAREEIPRQRQLRHSH